MQISFLICGVQKAATTAIWHYLRQHPALFMPETKELHFFDDETLDWSAPPYKRYHAYFTGAPAKTLWGEATPIYTYWRPSLGRIHDYNPDMKLIVSLRDPVARAWSHWRMARSCKIETLEFSDAIRIGRERMATSSELTGQHRWFSYVERGFYTNQIELLLSFFPRRNLFFLTVDDLRNKHAETLQSICRFLDAPPFPVCPERKLISPVKSLQLDPPGNEDVDYLRSLYATDVAMVQALTGAALTSEF